MMNTKMELSTRQMDAMYRLREYVMKGKPLTEHEDPRFRSPNVAAVVGRRGIGKTTVLDRLQHELSGNTDEGKRHLVLAPPLDAATLGVDFGLAAATVQSLYRTAYTYPLESMPFDGRYRTEHDQDSRFHVPRPSAEDDPQRRKLSESYESAFRSALMQQESYRDLALELAMSPDHFAKIVAEAAEDKDKAPQTFTDYVENIERFLIYRARHSRTPELIEGIKFVVIIDDLDLASPRIISPWLRLLLTTYTNSRVYWILAFDRDRLVAKISPSAFSLDKGSQQIDSICGNALLTKVVPVARQFELYGWQFPERISFVPFGKKDDSNGLVYLLDKLGYGHLTPLLPSNPRGLEGVYDWLDDSMTTNKKDQEDTVANTEEKRRDLGEAIRFFALVRGENTLLRELDMRGAHRLAATLSWRKEVISELRWAKMVAGVRDLGPLEELPVPDTLQSIIENEHPEAFLEVLIDTAMERGVLSPYQVIFRMHFLSQRVSMASCSLLLPEKDVRRHFELVRPDRIGAPLLWQSWSERATDSGEWLVKLGPELFWQAASGLRETVPSGLWRELYLPPIPRHRPEEEEQSSKILPCSLRAMLLLVDGLIKEPWTRLETLWNLWSPQDYSRIVALFTMRAYEKSLAVLTETFPQQPAATPRLEPSTKLLKLSPAEIVEVLNKERMEITSRVTMEQINKITLPPVRIAAIELNRAMRAYIGMPSFQSLIKS
jgi:hypothetical protein